MSLAILVPVLRRPHRVLPVVKSICRATAAKHRVVFICDPGDQEEQDAVREAGASRRAALDDSHRVELLTLAGNYAQKINAAIEATDEPLLFLGADDLHFHPGWLEAAEVKLTGGIGVVGTEDLCNRRVMAGDHSTHSLVARWYTHLGTIDESGKLLHEGYPHEFVDDELVATAKARGMYAHAADSVVEHLHPDVGKAPMDSIYAARRPRMRAGRRIFRSREHLWT